MPPPGLQVARSLQFFHSSYRTLRLYCWAALFCRNFLLESLVAKLQFWAIATPGLEKLHRRRRVCKLRISVAFACRTEHCRTGHGGLHRRAVCPWKVSAWRLNVYKLWLVYALPHATGSLVVGYYLSQLGQTWRLGLRLLCEQWALAG